MEISCKIKLMKKKWEKLYKKCKVYRKVFIIENFLKNFIKI